MSKTVVNKVTKVVWDNGFKPDGVNIPSVTSADQGKVLAVDSNGKWVAASPSAPQSELPEYTAADEGKILKVDDQGALEWADDDNTQYTAGDNISIVNGEISAVDTTYTAGDNVEISAQNVISATDTTYTAGTNVQINGNVISATDTTYSDATTTDAGLMSAADKVKLNGIETGAEANVNADWNAVSGDAQILNKPNLAAVATSGDYTDLTNKPTIPSYSAGANVQINDGVISATDTTYTAGSNVQINNGVISATDTTYSAGANISINAQNEISATDTKYTAGANITIDANNEISATDTTYSAGSGITITGTTIAADSQLPSYSSTDDGKVLSVDSNGDLEWANAGGGDADMVKTAIAEDYDAAKPMPFYPVYNSAITGTGNMLTDCFVAQEDSWAHIGGIRPFSTSRTDVYMAIYKDGYNKYKVVLFTTATSALSHGEVQVQWIAQNGTLEGPVAVTLGSAFSGTVNSGYYTNDSSASAISANGVFSTRDLIECAKDLSVCVYNSMTDAITAFGSWTIGSAYAEGDQVWKDGKLQTYTSGNWVDSDPIVEQIANAGGGSTGGILMPDKSNTIQVAHNFSNRTTYTATQDCFVEVFWALTGTTGSDFWIGVYESSAANEVTILHEVYPASNNNYTPGGAFTFPLKKGWTTKFAYTNGTLSSGSSYYTVFAAK